MKIIKYQDFLKLPIGTVYADWEDCIQSQWQWHVKDMTVDRKEYDYDNFFSELLIDYDITRVYFWC